MPTVITVERESATNSSRSDSFTTEGSSTGTGVHVSPTSGSPENSDLADDDQSWVYSDELEPSDSASRPRPSRYRRSSSRPTSVPRGPVRRHTTTERSVHRPAISRVHRHAAPAPPSSVDPQEDYPGYGRGFPPPNGAYGGRAPQPGYAQSFVSISPNPFQGSGGQVMPYGAPTAYPYPQNPFSPNQGAGGQSYFPPHQPAPYGAPGYGGHEVMPYGQAPGYGYGAYGMPPPAPQSQFYAHYADRVPSPKGTPAPPASVIAAEKFVAAEREKLAAEREQIAAAEREKVAAAEKEKIAAAEKIVAAEKEKLAAAEKEKIIAAQKEKAEIEKKLAALELLLADTKLEAERTKQEADRVKRETEEKRMASVIEAEKNRREAEEKKLAALERLLEDTKHDAEKAKKQVAEREAADKKVADEAAAKEITDKKVKEEVAKVKAEADKKTKAAEEAKTKAEEDKKAADEGKKKAEDEAKALAAPPSDKKKPIKFKDAVGRKFSFPFHLCQTWAGMEELIRQAFMHVEVIGPHVAEGHYDLVGPNGEIILPQVWETMIEPDWAITMHMWPLPEQPKAPPEEVIVVNADPRMPPRAPRRNRADKAPMPPPSGRRGPPPPPPPGWIGPPPGARPGGHDMGGGLDDIIVIEDNATIRSSRKKTKDNGVLGALFGGGGRKPAGKGPKKAESNDTCRVM